VSDKLNNSSVTGAACTAAGAVCRYADELLSLREQVTELSQQVFSDALTGLYNYRYFNQTLPLEIERTYRSGQPMALILLDIDHFKQFNDQWGHELGNQALAHVAKLITIAIRKLDMACRFGGEEFVVILPNTDLAQAVGVAERVRAMVAATPLETMAQAIPLTISLGVDEYRSQQMEGPEDFLRRVDTWLYQAKNAGRNRVAAPDLDAYQVAISADEKEALFDLWSESP
jgi:diguanylate cyclase (GGDEF)-like protein